MWNAGGVCCYPFRLRSTVCPLLSFAYLFVLVLSWCFFFNVSRVSRVRTVAALSAAQSSVRGEAEVRHHADRRHDTPTQQLFLNFPFSLVACTTLAYSRQSLLCPCCPSKRVTIALCTPVQMQDYRPVGFYALPSTPTSLSWRKDSARVLVTCVRGEVAEIDLSGGHLDTVDSSQVNDQRTGVLRRTVMDGLYYERFVFSSNPIRISRRHFHPRSIGGSRVLRHTVQCMHAKHRVQPPLDIHALLKQLLHLQCKTRVQPSIVRAVYQRRHPCCRVDRWSPTVLCRSDTTMLP